MESTANTENEVKEDAKAEDIHENGTNGNEQSNEDEGMDQTNSKPALQLSVRLSYLVSYIRRVFSLILSSANRNL